MTKKTAEKKKPKSVHRSVTIPTEDYEELERIAERKKVSAGWVVREAIGRYLDAESPLFRQRK